MLGGRTHPLLLGPVPGFLFEVDVPLSERVHVTDIAWLLTSAINNLSIYLHIDKKKKHDTVFLNQLKPSRIQRGHFKNLAHVLN